MVHVRMYVLLQKGHQAHQSRLLKPLLVCTVNNINLKEDIHVRIKFAEKLMQQNASMKMFLFGLKSFCQATIIMHILGMHDIL